MQHDSISNRILFDMSIYYFPIHTYVQRAQHARHFSHRLIMVSYTQIHWINASASGAMVAVCCSDSVSHIGDTTYVYSITLFACSVFPLSYSCLRCLLLFMYTLHVRHCARIFIIPTCDILFNTV